jgi:predicted metal-dependent phosphoesterase TrpH
MKSEIDKLRKSFFYDLHCHTKKSRCAISRIDKIIKIAKKRGLTGVAITDHDILYQGKTNINGIEIIPGVEITLKDRSHLLAYFITEPIEKESLTLEEATDEIRRQGGYSSLAHPYGGGEGWFKVKRRTREETRNTLKMIDAVELGNFKSPPLQKKKLRRLLKSLHANKALTAGSDAHIPGDIGFSVIKSKERINRENFLNILKNSEIVIYGNKNNYKRIESLLEESLTFLMKKFRLYHNKIIRKIFHYIIFNQYLRISNIFRSKNKFNFKEQ